MAFLAKIAVLGKGGPLGKMTVLADFQDLRGAGCGRTPCFPSTDLSLILVYLGWRLNGADESATLE